MLDLMTIFAHDAIFCILEKIFVKLVWSVWPFSVILTLWKYFQLSSLNFSQYKFIWASFYCFFRYMHRWELDAALDVLTMCSCHLPQSDPIRNEVLVNFIVWLIIFLKFQLFLACLASFTLADGINIWDDRLYTGDRLYRGTATF